jgi:hypothetical protein
MVMHGEWIRMDLTTAFTDRALTCHWAWVWAGVTHGVTHRGITWVGIQWHGILTDTIHSTIGVGGTTWVWVGTTGDGTRGTDLL